MDQARVIAWIFYAVEMATGKGPADFRAISEVADGINHAVPTQNELKASLAWLVQAGLVSAVGRGYVLTKQGETLVAECREDTTTVSGVWSRLTKALEPQVPGGSNTAPHGRRP